MFSILFFGKHTSAQNSRSKDTLVLRFESDKFDLRKPSEVYLKGFVKTVNLKEKDSIFITGHTDYTGNLAYNKELSLKRAEEVKSFFVLAGINNPMICAAKADFQPVSKDTSALGKRRNRRVEVIIKRHKTVYVQKVQVFPMTNNDFCTITTTNGCFLKITPNSVKTALEDSIYIRITEYNNAAEYIANRIPMSYDSGNKIMLFDSEQMMKIEAFSADKRELGLNKLFELECPHVDTSNGVQFYKLNEIEDDLQNLRFEYEYGRVVISEKVDEIPEEKVVEPEIKEEEIKVIRKAGSTTRKKKRFRKLNVPRVKIKRKSKTSSKSTSRYKPDPAVDIPIDTGRLQIIIDTGRIRIHVDTMRNYGARYGLYADCQPFYDPRIRRYNLCSETEAMQALLTEVKGIINAEKIDFTQFDFYTLCERFESLDYVRGNEKKRLSEEDIYGDAPSWKIRKRLFKREVLFKLKKFPGNPEYSALKKVKWTADYGIHDADKEMLLSLKDKIVDFRITNRLISNSGRRSRFQFNLQLKTENGIYTVPVESRIGHQELLRKVQRYQYAYANREAKFNDVVAEQLNFEKVIPVVQLLQLLNQFVYAKRHYCKEQPFVARDLLLPLEIRGIIRPNFEGVVYTDHIEVYNMLKNLTPWLHELEINKAEINAQIDYIQENLFQLQNYVCQPVFCIPDSLKWKYRGGNNGKGRIIRVGLGIFNFDRIYFLEAQQKVLNPILIDQNRNILLTNENRADFQVYTVIPGIKGLLAQSRPPQFKLVAGRVNVLFFHDKLTDKKYKTVCDLRNGEAIQGNTFQVKDITEQGRTLKGLKEELERVEW